LKRKTIFAFALIGMLAGCYPPTQTQYSPSVVEQPQPVHFFYGTLIDVRPAALEPGTEPGIGATASLSPWIAGLHVGGRTGNAELRISAAFVDIPLIASAPNLPATEYTVMPDYGTNPPDPYVHVPGAAAVIVVQNDHQGDLPMRLGDHVVVRVVGNSGRVMANPLPPAIAARLAAGPLPVPLDSGPAIASAFAPPLPDDWPSCAICSPAAFYFNPFLR
jgi:hypothetical protein